MSTSSAMSGQSEQTSREQKETLVVEEVALVELSKFEE